MGLTRWYTAIVMAALRSRCTYYILVLFLLSFFFFVFFPRLSQPSQTGCLPYFYTWCGLSANLECRFEMCCTRLAGNTGGKWRKKSPYAHYRTTLSGWIFATKACINNGKKLLNSNISSRCPHDMANFGPLTVEICWRIWGTPANFNAFRVLASLLQPRRSPEANQTLRDVRLSPGLVVCTRYIHFRCKIHFMSKSCVLVYWQRYCSALQRRALAKLCGVVQGMELRNFRRGRHLYSAGRPSRWALTHISSFLTLL